MTDATTAQRACPACGGANAADAVFCTHCHKALGEFPFVTEALRAEARWHERMAERAAGFFGRPGFLGIHAAWFLLWSVLNTAVLATAMRFDQPPFSLLGILLSMETIFITGFVLISENRQSAHADKRAELDYEVNVRTYCKICDMEARLDALQARLDAPKETPK